MSKRFTDTDKWKKPFIRSLQAPYKLLWFYILDQCDHSGIWQVDFEVANIYIGENLDRATAAKFFKDKIIEVDNGEKWFVPAFIEFQYGELNPANRAHYSVIKNLNRYNLLNENKPLTSPLQGAMDKDKDMDKEKDNIKVTREEFQEIEINQNADVALAEATANMSENKIIKLKPKREKKEISPFLKKFIAIYQAQYPDVVWKKTYNSNIDTLVGKVGELIKSHTGRQPEEDKWLDAFGLALKNLEPWYIENGIISPPQIIDHWPRHTAHFKKLKEGKNKKNNINPQEFEAYAKQRYSNR